MDGLTALGIAANIFQVVEFCGGVLSKANQYRIDGSVKENYELDLVVQDIQKLNEKLKGAVTPSCIGGTISEDQTDLAKLSDASGAVADELMMILSKLRIEKDSGRVKSIVQAFRSAINKEKIEELNKRLLHIRNELQFRVLVSIKMDIDAISIRANPSLQTFDEATRKILQAILDNKSIMKAELQVQTEVLRQELVALDIREEKRHRQVINTITMPQAAPSTNSNVQSREGILHNTRKQLYSRLVYRSIDDRYEDIKEAHQKTFSWIYDDSQNFNSWLNSKAGGIFWICGKAGSGKSTLMKYIAQDGRSLSAFEQWADGTQLLYASFYFWRNGTAMQRSHSGVLRSLLIQALKHDKRLFQVIFPHFFDFDTGYDGFPSYHELKRAFRLLITQKEIPLKIALLVDGLDEFDPSEDGLDNIGDIADFFKSAAESPNIKMVLSGRPLRVLEEAFKDRPQLRLEDLTHDDIALYVNDKIRQHDRIYDLALQNPGLADELVAEIVESASGVFLWVYLVVKSLIEGFLEYDTIDDLQRRLRALPKDLERLFMYIFDQLPKTQKYRSSQIFQIYKEFTDLRFDTYAPTRLLAFTLNAIELSFALEDSQSIKMLLFNHSEQELSARYKEATARLMVCTGGLLELGAEDRNNLLASPGSESSIRPLHKSVADFLEKPEVWSRIQQPTRSTGFLAAIALIQSMILRIPQAATKRRSARVLKEAIGYISRNLEASRTPLPFSYLFAMQLALDLKIPDRISNDQSEKASKRHLKLLLPFAAKYGLVSFLKTQIERRGPLILTMPDRSLLCSLPLCPIQDDEYFGVPIRKNWDPAILNLILQIGADPNAKSESEDESPWQAILRWCHFRCELDWAYKHNFLIDHGKVSQALRMLVAAGADPNASIKSSCECHDSNVKLKHQAYISPLFIIQRLRLYFLWFQSYSLRQSQKKNLLPIYGRSLQLSSDVIVADAVDDLQEMEMALELLKEKGARFLSVEEEELAGHNFTLFDINSKSDSDSASDLDF